jgi:hypothetical protein
MDSDSFFYLFISDSSIYAIREWVNNFDGFALHNSTYLFLRISQNVYGQAKQ